MAHRLAPSGKKVLIIERGDFVPREKANWEPKLVVGKRIKPGVIVRVDHLSEGNSDDHP